MANLPLQAFLISLEIDGIYTTIRDYERISLILQTRGQWTIILLQDMLLALLTKNEEQQELFLRRFNNFFTLNTDTGNTFSDIDIKLVLKALHNLAQQKAEEEKNLQNILERITPLKKQNFKNEKEVLHAVKNLIGENQTDTHKETILEHLELPQSKVIKRESFWTRFKHWLSAIWK